MSFNEQLTKLRKRNNITQIELANLMNVKQYVISSWETGRSEPNISQIIKLSDIFKIPTDYLLDRPIIISSSLSLRIISFFTAKSLTSFLVNLLI